MQADLANDEKKISFLFFIQTQVNSMNNLTECVCVSTVLHLNNEGGLENKISIRTESNNG